MNCKIWNNEKDGILICNHYKEGIQCMKKRPNVIIGPGVDFLEAVNYLNSIQQQDTIEWNQPQIIFNALSPWLKKLFENVVKNNFVKFACFPFPVNVEKFKPIKEKQNCFFIYLKHRPPIIYKQMFELINQNKELKKYTFKIFEYGKYTENEYKEYLQICKFGIFIDAHESQGFALQEALSCDCPLLIQGICLLQEEWSNNKFIWSHLPFYAPAETASYFNSNCGVIFKTIPSQQDLNSFIYNVEQNIYSPREFILQNLNINPCIEYILNFENL